ncbi:hypothetical protein N656DRAFT_527126 [Canariomyces notabilis]|uniref:Uncharacterized protein n=1 Tax=Canariomyces notabilis TaxID=2074819 RepID=A0AAN6THD5_9PEZI|nr:hypothetical protein N656DRAFT_527126 [Canariomyces arenarius]
MPCLSESGSFRGGKSAADPGPVSTCRPAPSGLLCCVPWQQSLVGQGLRGLGAEYPRAARIIIGRGSRMVGQYMVVSCTGYAATPRLRFRIEILPRAASNRPFRGLCRDLPCQRPRPCPPMACSPDWSTIYRLYFVLNGSSGKEIANSMFPSVLHHKGAHRQWILPGKWGEGRVVQVAISNLEDWE